MRLSKRTGANILSGFALVSGLILVAGSSSLRAETPGTDDPVVTISYYGDSDFTVTLSSGRSLTMGETVVFHTDDAGRLLLRFDDDSIYWSEDSDVLVPSAKLLESKIIRCSILLSDGALLGWEVAHEDRYGLIMPLGEEAPSIVVKGEGGNRQVTVRWTDSKAPRQYTILRWDAQNEKIVEIASVQNGTTYTDKGLVNGRQYHYSIRAVNTNSHETEDSLPISATPSGGSENKSSQPPEQRKDK